jgi:hypothetical protein
MVKSHTYICYLLFLTACADRNGGVVFPETANLSVSNNYKSDVYMRYPFRVILSGSSLYVMDLHAPEYYIHKYNMYGSDLIHKESFGKRGEGPEELLDAENIRIDSNGRLWTLDANRQSLVYWDNSEQEKLALSPELLRPLDFALINDSTFIVPDYSGENRICIVNQKGEVVERLFSIPQKRNTSKASLAQAWRSFIDYNRNTGILATVTQLGQVIEIYNINEKTQIAVVNQNNGAPVFKEKSIYAIPDGIMGYSDVHVADSIIFALFWGHSIKDIQQQKIKHDGGNRIHVFDIKGNPLKEYILDRYITGFCIDETNNRLIGLDVNSDEPIIEYIFENEIW